MIYRQVLCQSNTTGFWGEAALLVKKAVAALFKLSDSVNKAVTALMRQIPSVINSVLYSTTVR